MVHEIRLRPNASSTLWLLPICCLSIRACVEHIFQKFTITSFAILIRVCLKIKMCRGCSFTLPHLVIKPMKETCCTVPIIMLMYNEFSSDQCRMNSSIDNRLHIYVRFSNCMFCRWSPFYQLFAYHFPRTYIKLMQGNNFKIHNDTEEDY